MSRAPGLRRSRARWDDLRAMEPASSRSCRGHLAGAGAGARGLAKALCAELGDPDREPALFLERVFELEPPAWLRRVPGRETFAHAGLVLKRFRGDQLGEW